MGSGVVGTPLPPPRKILVLMEIGGNARNRLSVLEL